MTIGEPVPVGDGVRDRPHRTGSLARVLAGAGHQVIWWTSTFNHFKKQHLFQGSATLALAENFRVRLLKGRGYKRNLTLSRFLDHRDVARLFAREIESEPVPDIIVSSLPTVVLISFSAVMSRASNPILSSNRISL